MKHTIARCRCTHRAAQHRERGLDQDVRGRVERARDLLRREKRRHRTRHRLSARAPIRKSIGSKC